MENTNPNRMLPEANHNELDMESQDDSDQHDEGQSGPIDSTERPENAQPDVLGEHSVSPSDATTAPKDSCKRFGCIVILISYIEWLAQCINLLFCYADYGKRTVSINNNQTIGTPGTSVDGTALLNSSNTNLEGIFFDEDTLPSDSTIPCKLQDNNIPDSAEQQTTKPHCYSANGYRVYQPTHADDGDGVDDDDDDNDDDDDDADDDDVDDDDVNDDNDDEIQQDLHNTLKVMNRLGDLEVPELNPSLMSSGSSLDVADYQGLQQAPGPASQSWLSERGNPVCHPCSDSNRNSNHTKNASQQGEDHMEIIAHQELLISNSTTADDVGEDESVIFPGRYHVVWDNNNLKIPRYVCKLMAENPTKAFRVTPCPKTVTNEIADPTNYLLDSGYIGTSGYNRTLSSAQSQQLEFPPPTSMAGAVGFQQPMEIQARTSIAKLQSLGGASSDPNYDVNIRHDSILPTSNYSANCTDDSSLCDVLFVHEGYAMFTLRVPRGVHVNTLITMNQFTQQKAALLGEETPFFLQEGAMNLAKVKENSVINIVTLTEELV